MRTPISRVCAGASAPRRRWTLLVLAGVAAVLTLQLHAAQTPPRTVWDGVYSKAQAARGGEAYKLSCGYCHKDDLSGGFMDDGVGRAVALAGPAAFGSSFAERWANQTLGDLVYVIASTMPKDAPTSLPLPAYVDIVAFLLEKNGVPDGGGELAADVAALREVAITAPRR